MQVGDFIPEASALRGTHRMRARKAKLLLSHLSLFSFTEYSCRDNARTYLLDNGQRQETWWKKACSLTAFKQDNPESVWQMLLIASGIGKLTLSPCFKHKCSVSCYHPTSGKPRSPPNWGDWTRQAEQSNILFALTVTRLNFHAGQLSPRGERN